MSIPKIVHFLWMSEKKDDRTLLCLESWKKVLNGYEIKEWNSQTFPYKDFAFSRIAAEKKKWAYVTDFFRLWVLENYGGIYLDADIVLHKNFDAFLEHDFFCATEFTRQIGAHCMGSVPHHPFVRDCLNFYKSIEYTRDTPIPHIMTCIMQKRYKYDDSIANFSNKPLIVSNAVDDEIAIYPDNFFTIDISDNQNVAVHLGMGSWRDDPTENPVYTDVLEDYFVKRYYLQNFNYGSKIKNFLRLLMPAFIQILWKKRVLKVKNMKALKFVKKYYGGLHVL